MKPTTNPAAKVRERERDSKLAEHELEQRESVCVPVREGGWE